MKIYIILGAILLSVSVSAQETKIGYINLDLIFANMPEIKKVEDSLASYQIGLEARLKSKYEDFQVKVKEFQDSAEMTDEVLKKDAEKELQDMQAQIDQFQDNANQAIGQKKQDLLNPLRAKVKMTINKHAEENGYSHVFATDGSLVYVRDESGNISQGVATELGFELDSDQ